MLLTLVTSGCMSKPSIQQSPRIPPKAAAMKPPHDLTKQLNKIYLRLREMIVENEQQTLYLQDYIRAECMN